MCPGAALRSLQLAARRRDKQRHTLPVRAHHSAWQFVNGEEWSAFSEMVKRVRWRSRTIKASLQKAAASGTCSVPVAVEHIISQWPNGEEVAV